MRDLILKTIFARKLKYLYMFYFIVVTIILVSLFRINDDRYLVLNHFEDYQVQIKSSFILTFKTLIPLTVFLLLLEHHQDYEKMLVSYLSKTRIYFSKLSAYSYMMSLIFTGGILIVYLSALSTGFMIQLDLMFIKKIISLYLSMLIMIVMSLMFIRRKKMMVSMLLLSISMIYQMIGEDITPLFIYLYPVAIDHLTDYKYTIIYQIVYLVLICFVAFLHYRDENIT